MTLRIGVLALQGDFDAHLKHLMLPEVEAFPLRSAEQLSNTDALVLPGGESSTMLRLMDDSFRDQLKELILRGTPTLATCAGSILLAKEVLNPEQESLALLNIRATRNAYGRQKDSFICESLELSEKAKEVLGDQQLAGIFIRAPRFELLSPEVEVIAWHEAEPVFVCQKNIFAASFHPELLDPPSRVHLFFVDFCHQQVLKRNAGEAPADAMHQ